MHRKPGCTKETGWQVFTVNFVKLFLNYAFIFVDVDYIVYIVHKLGNF